MAEGARLDGIRTLIVDDDPGIRRVLGRTLREWGAALSEAENGARGIVELKRARDEGKPYELTFLDSAMAGVNGFEVAQRIREQHPDEVRRLVLMVEESHAAQDEARARALGLGACLAKPLSRPGVVEAIARVLGPESRAAEDAAIHPVARTRILLAEDSADTRSIVGHFLSAEDFQVDGAENGKIALDLFRLAVYDVVLMDIQMPVYDGYWAVARIREWEKRTGSGRTPVVAITAYAMTEDAQKCLRAGFDGYVTKPLPRDRLLSTVRRYARRTSS